MSSLPLGLRLLYIPKAIALEAFEMGRTSRRCLALSSEVVFPACKLAVSQLHEVTSTAVVNGELIRAVGGVTKA
jgi:hypothetical protein